MVADKTEFYVGLRALSSEAFPKRCPSCGKVFHTLEELIRETEAVGIQSGLKASLYEDDTYLVEMFRNCPCGSTLMEEFGSRRSNSPLGDEKRHAFDIVLAGLIEHGMERELASAEMRRLLRGQRSEVLNDYLCKVALGLKGRAKNEPLPQLL